MATEALYDYNRLGEDTTNSLLYQLGLKNGIYAGNDFPQGNPMSAIMKSVGGGNYALWPSTANSVFVGQLQYYNAANTGKEGLLTITTGGVNRVVDTVKDNKMYVFESIVGDAAGGTAMAAPICFVGWLFMVVGRGVLP